jgi:hypothetical protein
MDFIERVFGISADGGSGTFEFLLFAIPVVALYIIYRARSIRNNGDTHGGKCRLIAME